MRWITPVLLSAISVTALANSGPIQAHPLCTNIRRAIGDNPDKVLINIGSADAISEREVTSPHVIGRNDKEVILRYSDGHILFHHLSDKKIYILLTAKLSRSHFSENLSNAIPDDLGDLIYRYGTPDIETDNSVRYHCTFEGVEWFDVHHHNNKVTGINYTGYLD